MAPTSRKKPAKAKPIGRGTTVSFQLGASIVVGVVIDDWGPIGPGGVRVLRIRAVLDDPDDPLEAEVREDRLTPVLAAAS